MDIQASPTQDFFGKDKLSPFIGIVEDVNDPKHAARVKVRCVGWHPQDKDGENGLATDDLPWARVSAPTTHAQQARVGSKHGLMAGSWVWGFFLDGNDAQDLMVCGSFPFTARAATRDLHVDDTQEEGRLSDSNPGFTQSNANTRHPNTQVLTDKEKGAGTKKFSDSTDPAGAITPDDSLENECGDLVSASRKARNEEMRKGEQGNNESQVYDIAIGDGACGSVPHAAEDAQRMFEERMPSMESRFMYGDQVWNKFTGAHLNLNGIMAQLSLDICAMIQMLLTQTKATQEEQVNRPKLGSMCLAATERDGPGTLMAEEQAVIQDDSFHAIFTQLMEQICGQVMGMLQQMDSGGDDGESSLADPGAPCFTNQVMQNIEVLIEDILQQSITQSEQYVASLNLPSYSGVRGSYKNLEIPNHDSCTGYGDYTSDELANQINDIYANFNDADPPKNNGNGSGSGGNEFASALSMIGTVGNLLQFSSVDKYALVGAKTHNRAGDATQSQRLREGGCAQERTYNTVEGAMQGMMGALGGLAGGGSSGSGSGSGLDSDRLFRIQNLGFGGLPSDTEAEFSTTLCEDAITVKDRTPCGQSDNGVTSRWQGTTFHIEGSVDRLYGEKFSGGKATKNDRVLLRSQTNRTENGIWMTGSGSWRRPDDAKNPTQFEIGKKIQSGRNTYMYIGPKKRPNVDEEALMFSLVQSEVKTERVPVGKLGAVIGLSLPSSDEEAAANFKRGTPNQLVVTGRGKCYYSDGYPSIYIPEYNCKPVPVVDEATGELVAVLTNPKCYSPNKPDVPTSIIPDKNPIGISTNDPSYDIVLGGVVVGNTGFDYTDPIITVIDKDTGKENGKVNVTIVGGRIVEVSVLDSGQGFRRLPDIILQDSSGFGAKLLPVMSVIPQPLAKPLPVPVQMVFCPGKNQVNGAS